MTTFAERTSFVGRARDLGALAGRFAAGARLVTLVGAGGIGKTRLARRFAAEAETAVEPAWFCDLSAARSLESILGAVAEALAVPIADAAADEGVARVGRALAGRGRSLLVLDNFEQVAALAPDTVGRWLVAAPDARLLVTSREVLGLAGEARVELGPLEPDEALALFEERAHAVAPGLTVDAGTRAILGDLLEALDRLPLAIELAAARAGVLTPAELNRRLVGRFELLRGGGRDGPARHATLRGAIDWSWSLLSPAEQELLAACAVFRGGFSLAAAERVLRGPSTAASTVDALQSLRDKSLILVRSAAAFPAELRFDLYESVREFAAERLDASGWRGAVEARHAAWFLEEAEGWAQGVEGPQGAQGLARLRLELGNLVAAHERSLAGSPAVAARLALSLRPALLLSGPAGLHLALLGGAIEAAARAGDAALSARALAARGEVRGVIGQPAAAERDLVEALARAREAALPALEGEVLRHLGALFRDQGRWGEARARLEEALRVVEEAGARATLGSLRGSLGTLYRHLGRVDAAAAHYDAALAIHREVGDRRKEGIVLGNLGHLAVARERIDQARAFYQQALAILAELEDRRSEGILLGHLASLDAEAGDLDRAAEGYARCVALLRMVGDRPMEAVFRAHQGALLAAQDRVVDAQEAFAAARRLLSPGGDPRLEVACRVLEGTGAAALSRQAAARGDATAAASYRAEAAAAAGPGRGGAEAPEGDGDDPPALAARSDHTRFALRLLQHALARRPEPAHPGRPAGADAAAPSGGARALLELGPDAAWFRLDGAAPVDLRGRRRLRLLLGRLAAERRDAPGQPLPLEALLAAAWPGDPVAPEAGASRVYEAIATLRRLGLREVLITQGQGYLLHPSVGVVEGRSAGGGGPG